MHDHIDSIRSVSIRICTLAVLLAQGCAPAAGADGNHPPRPEAGKVDSAGTVLLGGTSYCPDRAPYDAFDSVIYTSALAHYQALSFQASEDDQPDITLVAAEATPDARPQVWLEDAAGNLVGCAHNDEDTSAVNLDSSSLVRGGLYYLIFANKSDGDASFKLRVDCSQGDCAAVHDCGVAVPLSP